MEDFRRCSNPECETEFPAGFDLCPNCMTQQESRVETARGDSLGGEPAASAHYSTPSFSASDATTEESDYCECDIPADPGELCDCGKLGPPIAGPQDIPAATEAVGGGSSEDEDAPFAAAAEASCPPLQIRFGADIVLHVGQSLLIGRGYAGVAPVLFEWLAAKPGISRRHCLIQVDSSGTRLCDLGSLNGTRANGVPLRAGENLVLTGATLPVALALGRYAQIIIERQETPL